MLFRTLVAFAAMFLSLSAAPARAQEMARAQADLADMGVWVQEYQGIMSIANEPFVEMTAYVEALQRFGDGRQSAGRTRRQIRTWQRNASASLARARVAAENLRDPPSLAQYGRDGAALDMVLHSMHGDIEVGLTETEAVVVAIAELGLAALDDRAKGYAARERALYQASIRLTTVDRRRIDVAAAAISREHPTQALMVATQHYYDTLIAIPAYALQEQDGAGDLAAVIESLRASARGMRAALTRSRMLSEQLATEARNTQGGPGAEMSRIMLRMLETFPPSIAAYEGLAVGVDEAADALEQRQNVNDVWADQEENDRPFLEEIARLEAVRAQLLATNNQRAL